MLFVSLFWHLFLLEELQHFLQTTSQGNKVLVFIFWISCPLVRVEGWFRVPPQWVFFPSPDCPMEGFFPGTLASLFCECLMGITEKSLQNRCKLPCMCGPRGSHSLTSPHSFSANSLPTPGDFCWPHQPPGRQALVACAFPPTPTDP